MAFLFLVPYLQISATEIDTDMSNVCISNRIVVPTPDGFHITLYHYPGMGTPILMIPGMFENNLVFDYGLNRSLARYLSNRGSDVWILNLRTHDGDGDPGIINMEGIHKSWDFDNTYLKEDLTTAVSFIKNDTGYKKLLFIGHSMGGYLIYAYAEIFGQKNISGIITIGSCGVGYKMDITMKILRFPYGRKENRMVLVRRFSPKTMDVNNRLFMRIGTKSECFYRTVTKPEVQMGYIRSLDDEPAGVVVDMMYGFDGSLWNGDWVDPQTGYDYTKNLSKIRVPIFFIAGYRDKSDPIDGIKETFRLLGSDNKSIYVFGNYGHVDLLLGNNVEYEVYPAIYNWIHKGIDLNDRLEIAIPTDIAIDETGGIP